MALLAICTVGWGVIEGGDVRVLPRQVRSAKVQRSVRLVAISDLHLGALTLDSRLDALVALVNAQNPDVVLLVGDIVNDHPEALEPQARKLRGIVAPLGMFGVFGNHERYEGDERSAMVFRWIGAELLRSRARSLPSARYKAPSGGRWMTLASKLRLPGRASTTSARSTFNRRFGNSDFGSSRRFKATATGSCQDHQTASGHGTNHS